MPGRPLKIGLHLPACERELDGRTARWTDLCAMARRAEAVGFDALWVVDHLLPVREEQETLGAWECWSLLAALAAATERIELGPLVSCAGFRNPALLAKMAATVDEISGGRLILGLGAGWYEPEFHAFGYPFDHRVSRFAEALHIVTSLLRTGWIDFQGTYYIARDCELRPRGPRAGGPPVMVGTLGGQWMLRLAAQYGDEWNGMFFQTGNRVDGVASLQAAVDAACREVGRDPATLKRSVTVFVKSAPHGIPWGWGVDPVVGDADDVADIFHGYARAGIAQVQVTLEPNSLAGIEGFAAVLERLDRA